MSRPSSGPLLLPYEVAALFRVNVKTVARWANEGKLRSVRTVGGHHRYFAADVAAMVAADERAGERTHSTRPWDREDTDEL